MALIIWFLLADLVLLEVCLIAWCIRAERRGIPAERRNEVDS